MKKLKYMLVAAASIACGAAFGATDGLPNESRFYESDWGYGAPLGSGYKTVAGENKNANEAGIAFYYDAVNSSENASYVTNDLTAAGDNQYLYLETDGGVYNRAIKAQSGFPSATNTVTIPGTGIYIDTLVQFTPTEEDPAREAGSKFAIFMKENLDGDNPTTNLCVMARLITGATWDPENEKWNELTADTNVFTLSGTYEAGKWYRLTVESIANVFNGNGQAASVGFRIYVTDAASATVSKVPVAATTATIGDLPPGFIASSCAAGFSAKQIFVAMYDGDEMKAAYQETPTLTSIGFQGTGKVDEIAISDKVPEFLGITVEPATVGNADVTVTADGNVVSVGEDEKYYYVPYGANVVITYTAKEGYYFSDGSKVKTQEYASISESKIDTETYSNVEGVAMLFSSDGATTNVFNTLAGAVDAATAVGQTVVLLKATTLTSTLNVDQPITLDFQNNNVKLATSGHGIVVTDEATLQNGTITSQREAYPTDSFANGVIAIYNNATSAVYSNLTVNAAYYRQGMYCIHNANDNTYTDIYANGPTFNVNCYNVKITGGGTQFLGEGVNLTLDKDCSATGSGDFSYNAAVYAASNARITINGGAYNNAHALFTGNLGGTITVNGGTFTGDVYSRMKTGENTGISGNKASFILNAGTFNGAIAFYDTNSRAYDSFKRAVGVEIDEPSGYAWSDVRSDTYQVLGKVYSADVYVDGEKKDALVTKLGNGNHVYAIGETETASRAGVYTDVAAWGLSGTYYVSKIELLSAADTVSKTFTFEYDGTTLNCTAGSAAVTENTISYNVTTTAQNNPFAKIYLTKYTIAVTGVALSESTKELDVGGTFTLTATIEPANATTNTVTWSSDAEGVATVDASGKVTAVAAGTATITVTTTDGGKTATCSVTVKSSAPVIDPKGEGTTTNVVTGVDTAEKATNAVVSAIVVPSAVATQDSGLTAATYKGYFTATATERSEGGYNVTVKLDETKIELSKTVEDVADELSGIAAGTATSATVTAKPGLYYVIATCETVGGTYSFSTANVMLAKTSDDGSITLNVTRPSEVKGFMKVMVFTEMPSAGEYDGYTVTNSK